MEFIPIHRFDFIMKSGQIMYSRLKYYSGNNQNDISAKNLEQSKCQECRRQTEKL